MKEYPFIRKGDALIPTTPESEAALREVKDRREILLSFRSARNVRHHRLLFGILRFIKEHTDRFPSDEAALTALKIATGHTSTFIDSETGEVFHIPRSISFAAMSQQEFSTFFDDACRVIAARWLPAGTTPEDVRRELFLMVDGPYAADDRRRA